MRRATALLLPALVLTLPGWAPSAPTTSTTASTDPAADVIAGVDAATGAVARETEPIVLTGASFPDWAAPADVPVEANSVSGARCNARDTGEPPVVYDPDLCTHNRYEDPDVSSQQVLQAEGVAVERLLGYRWDGERYEQIPFQVDEVWVRYLANDNSGFSFYSETDQHTAYAFDREGFRYDTWDASDPCTALPSSAPAPDPVPGLDTDDELVFMVRDLGAPAPPDAPLPDGVEELVPVTVTDPVTASELGVAYVALAADEGGARPAFDTTNGYVRYERDPDADVFLYSESSYSGYGAAAHGPWLDPETGECVDGEDDWRQHRPGDQATVWTPRYRFRYEGRWLMTDLRVSRDPTGDWVYGADLVDQWKARAFQQRPGGQTPCCGYEEEVNNWGGSSILMGERAGPVRVIRETWGADSGTNVVRRETFYRDEIRFEVFLRVHVIPPLDGIYAQWDYNPGVIDRYHNPQVPDGVPVDGVDDEVYGNGRIHVGPDGVSYDDPGTNALLGGPLVIGEPDDDTCAPDDACTYNDVDTADPFFSGPSAALNWEQLTGDHGTIVSRFTVEQVTPGAAQTVVALPYYRDDACFDDGTGSTPGPHLVGRGEDTGEAATWTDAEGTVRPRECWDAARAAEDPDYAASPPRRWWQGSIGTHGMHLLLIADSDNAHTTLPLTEIDTEQRVVVLPGRQGNVGEAYGREPEHPLIVSVG